METIVNIDICNSTIMAPILRSLRSRFQSMAEETLGQESGVWLTQGDCVISTFDDPQTAFPACTAFLNRLGELNREESLAVTPLFVRIGMDLNDGPTIRDITPDRRGEHVNDALNSAAKLQKGCPVGKIAVSRGVYDRLGFFQKLFRPAQADDSFVLESRQLLPQEEKHAGDLLKTQRDALPAMCLLNWDRLKPDSALKDLRRLLTEELVVVFGDTTVQSRGILLSAATSDAVGVMEALALLQHQNLRVGIDEWNDTADLVANRNVMIVGSGATNLYSLVVNDVVEPIRFVKGLGRVSDQIVVGLTNPKVFGRHATQPADSGLIVLAKSVFNPRRTMLWIAGNTGMGTQAVALFLQDLLKGQVSLDERAVGCIVGASVREGVHARVSDYFRKWRLSSYRLLRWVDRDGQGFDLKN